MQKGLLEEIGFGDRQAHPRFTPSLRTRLAESSPKRGKQCQKFYFIVSLRLGTWKSPKYLRHREAAGRGDPSPSKRSHGLPRYARNDESE